MKRAPRSLQHHVLYRKYNGQDSEISALLGKCGLDWVSTNNAPKQSGWNGELPLLAEQIDYVRAAGNYVELHGLGRTILHRTTMAALCEQLASSEFVRVHRSVLVRMSAVKRWLPGHVEMLDGSVYRIGARYRASIADLTK